MSPFTPPTDNLYKFLALFGLVLIVAFIFPLVFFHKTGMDYLEQLRRSKEFNEHEQSVKQRLEALKFRQQQSQDRRSVLQKRLETMNSASNSTEVDKLEGLIKEVNREIESIDDSYNELSLNLALRRAQITYEETVNFNLRRDSRVYLYAGLFGVVVGSALSFFGFRLWYRKLQMYLDQIVKKEAEEKLSPALAKQPIEQGPPNEPAQAKVPDPAK